MGIDAQMLMQTDEPIDEICVERLNYDLVRSIYAPLGVHGYIDQLKMKPITPVRAGDAGIDPRDRIPAASRNGHWYWIHLMGRYYGERHEQGDIIGYITVAEWLEHRIPGARVWYALKRHFYTVGHGVWSNL